MTGILAIEFGIGAVVAASLGLWWIAVAVGAAALLLVAVRWLLMLP